MMDATAATELDTIFGALADPTRRDILRRVSTHQLTISQLAERYNLTFAAVSKHLMVLEKAKLIIKRKIGRKQYVQASPAGLKDADEYLEFYRRQWQDRLDSLGDYLKSIN